MAAYYQMKLFFHGGKCCGIKHIEGFNATPDSLVCAEEEGHFRDNDSMGWDVTTEYPFFTAGAPEETGRERLDRYLNYLLEHRPGGIVEVVLVHYQKEMWHDLLTEKGFKIVSQTLNSNSSNVIYVYHLIMEWGEPDDDDDYDPFDDSDDDYIEDCDCDYCRRARGE